MQSINENFSLKNTGFSSAADTSALPRHRWYYFKEGFSPNLVARAAEENKCGPESLIVDPFNGSGTVTLTSAGLNIPSVGFEVNPFTAFLAKTKLINIKKDDLLKFEKEVAKGINKGQKSELKGYSTFSKKKHINKWLFNDSVLSSFSGGWKKTRDYSPRIKSLYRLALIGAAMDNCNAVRDGKCLRYRSDWQEKPFTKTTFIDSFRSRLDIIVEDVEVSLPQSSEVHLGDVRTSFIGKNLSFDLCVTSPPYLNSFDYSDIYRPELFLGEFVKNNQDLNRVRLQTVRSHMQTAWKPPSSSGFGELYTRIHNELSERVESMWNSRIPLMVQAYFEDMEVILKNLRAAAKPGAELWLVVSTSAYGGVEIPVDLILADIGTRVEWRLREVGVLRYLRSSSQRVAEKINGGAKEDSHIKNRLRESVVILTAGK